MVKHYRYHSQRKTKVDYIGKEYMLDCEKGRFGLYNRDGELIARSCRFPLGNERHKDVFWDNLRPEDKFSLKERAENMLGLVERQTKITHEILVIGEDAVSFETALFIFVCTALGYHGYSPKGKMPTVAIPEELTLDIDRGLVVLEVEGNAVIFCEGENTKCAKHVSEILSDLCVRQYVRLGRGWEK